MEWEQKAPRDWNQWREQGFALVTPEAYQLYRQFRTDILKNQAKWIHSELQQRNQSWWTQLKSGVLSPFIGAGSTPKQEGGGMKIHSKEEKEIIQLRSQWLRDRVWMEKKMDDIVKQRVDMEWGKRKLKQSGGNPEAVGGWNSDMGRIWDEFELEEHVADCQYRWRDKIANIARNFYEEETRAWNHFQAAQKAGDPRVQAEQWRWNKDWVERRYDNLLGTIESYQKRLEQLDDPEWTPYREQFGNAPENIYEMMDKVRNKLWYQKPEVEPVGGWKPWVIGQWKQFLNRSSRCWNQWEPEKTVEAPWMLLIWWWCFGNQHNNGWKVGIHELIHWMNKRRDIGVSSQEASLQDAITRIIESGKHQTVYEQHEYMQHLLPALDNWLDYVASVNDENSWDEIPDGDWKVLQDNSIRSMMMMLLGWKGWWNQETPGNWMEWDTIMNQNQLHGWDGAVLQEFQKD